LEVKEGGRGSTSEKEVRRWSRGGSSVFTLWVGRMHSLQEFEEVSEQSPTWAHNWNNSEGNLFQPQHSLYTSNLQNYMIKNMSCSKTLFQQK
jgi:hypothetical protein